MPNSIVNRWNDEHFSSVAENYMNENQNENQQFPKIARETMKKKKNKITFSIEIQWQPHWNTI